MTAGSLLGKSFKSSGEIISNKIGALWPYGVPTLLVSTMKRAHVLFIKPFPFCFSLKFVRNEAVTLSAQDS